MNAAVEKVESNIDAIFRGSNTYSDLSNRINQNSSDIRNNRKLAAQGIAGLAAMTNIPSPAIAGTTSIGTGVGYFDNESSIAIGVSHYFENNISIKGSVSSGFNSGNSTVVGAGVSYTWN
jgi:autotransporter adhesin